MIGSAMTTTRAQPWSVLAAVMPLYCTRRRAAPGSPAGNRNSIAYVNNQHGQRNFVRIIKIHLGRLDLCKLVTVRESKLVYRSDRSALRTRKKRGRHASENICRTCRSRKTTRDLLFPTGFYRQRGRAELPPLPDYSMSSPTRLRIHVLVPHMVSLVWLLKPARMTSSTNTQ
jgi:hypothetical protein